MPTPIARGQRISEYVLEERLGAGGFGEVWRARHHIFADRVVAVKIPTDPALIGELRREGVIQHRLEGENVIRCLGLDPYADPPYLVMDYVDGLDLRQIIEREGRLPWPRAASIALDVARVLARAHEQGVLHGDVKPENILVDRKGSAYLADFGVGSAIGSLDLSGTLETRKVAGTIPYLSPEQRTPGARVDARSDIYALGIVLFEMLCGRRPAGVEVPSEVEPSVPPAADDIFRRSYAHIDRRYPDIRRFVRDLEAARAGRPVSPPVAPPPFRVPRREPAVPPRDYPRPQGPSVASIVGFVLAIIFLFSCIWPAGIIPALIGRSEAQAARRGERSLATLTFAQWAEALGVFEVGLTLFICCLTAL